METYATYILHFKVTSYEGYNHAQIFSGRSSMHVYLVGMISESSGPDALMDFFREIGVPLSIRRDNAKMQASQAWNDLMRRYCSKDEFTEPYNPQQNPAERRWSSLKNAMKRTFQDTGANPKA